MVSNIVRIQLIDGPQDGYLDVKENVAFPLNFAISDIRDISSRTGSFSKTIKLAGTKNNNLLLNNYFDVNVKAGTFNVNKIQKCAILQNNVVIKDNFYLRLLKVVKVQNRGEETDDLVEYEVQVRDSIGDFFKDIDNKEIVDLNGWGNFTHNYSVSNVVSSFNHTWSDGYKYVLPWIGSPDPFNYDLSELLPGIYAKQIFDKIHEQAGYSYEWSNYTGETVQFDKLIIPYSGDKKKLSEEDKSLNEVIASSLSANTSQSGQYNLVPWTLIPTTNEIKDLQSYFNPTTSEYSNVFLITPPNSLQYEVNIDYDIIINNGETENVLLFGVGFLSMTPRVVVKNAGNTNKGVTNLTISNLGSNTTIQNITELTNNNQTIKFFGNNLVGSNYYLAPGDVTLASGNLTTTINCSNLSIGEILRLGVDSTVQIPAGTFWVKQSNQIASTKVKTRIRINDITIKIYPNSDNGLIPNAPISLKSFLPKKVKQSEFLKSIYQKYNLYAEIDPQNPNKIIYTSRDEYYDSGALKDWTQKLDKSQNQELFFVPEISSKKLILSYKDDENDAGLSAYRGEVGETYGQVEIEFENENVRGIQRKDEIFSPTLNLPTEFNAILPVLAPDFKMNMRVLIDGGNYSCDAYTITQSPGDVTTLTQYPYMGLLDKPTNASFSIEYAQPDYYPYNPGLLTQNNLYVNFWRRTLAQINSGKLLKAYFWLTEEDIFKLRLNDKIKVNNALWYINKVVDYDANNHKPTLVELLSVEDDLKLPRFGRVIKPVPIGVGTVVPVGPVKPVRPVKPIITGVADIIRKRTMATSVFDGVTDTSSNLGVRNVITKDFTGVVIGNDKLIDENGFYIEDTSITDGEVNINNIVSLNTSGLIVNELSVTENSINYNSEYITDDYIDPLYFIESNQNIIFQSGDTIILNGNVEIPSGYTLNGVSVVDIISGATGGIISLNGLTSSGQTFTTGTSGTDFGISSSSTVHTFNLPIASATNTGKLSSTDWTTFNNKQNGDPTLTALAAYNTNGILTQTATDTFVGRTITGGSCIGVTNGNGVSGNPTISLTGGTLNGSLTITGNLEADDFTQNYSNSIQTTNGTITTIKTIPTVSEYVYQFEVNVVAGQNNTSKGITSKIIASYKNNGGTVTRIGDEFSIVNSDFTTANVSLSISGTNILIRVTGEAATTIDWGCSVVIHKMPMGVI